MSQHSVVMNIAKDYIGGSVRGAQKTILADINEIVAADRFSADAINGGTVNRFCVWPHPKKNLT